MLSRLSDRLMPHLFVSMPHDPMVKASLNPPHCAAGDQGYLSANETHHEKTVTRHSWGLWVAVHEGLVPGANPPRMSWPIHRIEVASQMPSHSPSNENAAGPVIERTWPGPFHEIVSVPPGISTQTSSPTRPRRCSAATVAHAPLPQASVHPAPRSCTRRLTKRSSTTCAKHALAPCGKHVGRVDPAAAGGHLGQRDQFVGGGAWRGCVLQRTRQPHGAVLHGGRDQRLHLLQLRGCWLHVVVAKHHPAHRGRTDVGAEVDADALFFQPREIAVQRAPCRRDAEVFVGRLVVFNDAIVERCDRVAFP